MNIKKFSVVLLLLVMIICLLSGCSKTKVEEEKAVNGYFVIIGDGKNIGRYIHQELAYDPATMVMYAIFGGTDGKLAVTPLYNPDATLRIYNPNAD